MGWELVPTFLNIALFSLLSYRLVFEIDPECDRVMGGKSSKEEKGSVKETPGKPLNFRGKSTHIRFSVT